MARLQQSSEPLWYGREFTGVDELHHLGYHYHPQRTIIEQPVMPFHEILVLLSGSAHVTVDGRPRPLAAGQMTLFRMGACLSSQGMAAHGKFLWIGVDPQPASRLNPNVVGQADRLQLERLVEHLSEDVVATPPGLLRAVGAWYEHRQAGPLRRRACALLVLAELLDWQRQGNAANEAASVLVRPAIELIAADPGRPHTIVSLAKRCGMGTTAFRTQFALATGRQIGDHLQEARLAKACAELRAGATNQRAALAAGLSSGQYLSDLFNRIYGMTPQAWRIHEAMSSKAAAVDDHHR